MEGESRCASVSGESRTASGGESRVANNLKNLKKTDFGNIRKNILNELETKYLEDVKNGVSSELEQSKPKMVKDITEEIQQRTKKKVLGSYNRGYER